MVDHFEKIIGPMSWSTLDSRLMFIQDVDIKQDTSHKRLLLRDLLRKIEATLGPLDTRTCDVRIILACNYLTDLEHTKAFQLGWHIATLAQRLDTLYNRTYYYAEALSIVANSQYALGEIHSAEGYLREAIELCISIRGPRDIRARSWLMLLKEWLVEQGQLNSAAQVQKRWKKTIQDSSDDS